MNTTVYSFICQVNTQILISHMSNEVLKEFRNETVLETFLLDYNVSVDFNNRQVESSRTPDLS